jgi:hypothetical protein
MAPWMFRYGAYVPGPASCWPSSITSWSPGWRWPAPSSFAAGWSAALDPVPLAGSPRSTPMTPTGAASNRTPRAGGVRHQATRPVCRPPNEATWAGSPAASSRIGPRLSAPSSSPNSSAVSTPPRSNWARPGRRYARPSPATAWACPPATPKPSASGPSPPPASAPGSRSPRRWTRCLLPSTRMRSRRGRGHRRSFTSGSAATRSAPPWAPTSSWSRGRTNGL